MTSVAVSFSPSIPTADEAGSKSSSIHAVMESFPDKSSPRNEMVRRCAISFLSFAFIHVVACGDSSGLHSGGSIGVAETIVSPGGEFELGFFRSGNSSAYFVGIWYKKISLRTVVWVMNRDFPCISASPTMALRPDGNLVVIEGRVTYDVTNISEATNATAELLDSGNLVVADASSGAVLWQSFDYPTDTLLPGMKLGFSRSTGMTWSLSSWKSWGNPFPGAFTMEVVPDSGEIVIMQGGKRYWTSGTWDGKAFSLVSARALHVMKNVTYFSDGDESYFTFSGYRSNSTVRISLDISGQVKEFSWSARTESWDVDWSQPAHQCDVYAYCGSFASCNQETNPVCECMPAFEPQSRSRQDTGDVSSGCSRKLPLDCDRKSKGQEDDGFLTVSGVILPVNSVKVKGASPVACEITCLNNCSCSGYAYNNNSEGCLIWMGDLLNVVVAEKADSQGGEDFNLKVSSAELRRSRRKPKPWVWIILTLSLFIALVASALIAFYACRRKLLLQGKDLVMFDLDTELSSLSGEFTDLNDAAKERRKDVELPLFSFASVAVATENFSAKNKIGEGGFGPVYLGKLSGGNQVAVKRLSRKSGQGWEELKTEATLIAKLQHRNLVRLLGCSLDKGEKILIYEYLPNKSLDHFLFDERRRGVLDWETRIRIVKGIAQGLLYLHEYSRLKVIHRDLKASNILLDKDMNPKISDFGMARIFGDDDSQATNRIVGTYGYMSPEYATDGLFSVKSDVFSFGVLFLEILSGRRNTGSYYSDDSLSLLGHAWDLWIQGKEAELIDPLLVGGATVGYVNVALLCVQERAVDRPTVAEIVSMLSNNTLPVLTPKLPTSSILRSVMGDAHSSQAIHFTRHVHSDITIMTRGR